jgi:hypothetical protein
MGWPVDQRVQIGSDGHAGPGYPSLRTPMG